MSDYLLGQGLLGAFNCVMLEIFSVLCEYFNDSCVVLCYVVMSVNPDIMGLLCYM